MAKGSLSVLTGITIAGLLGASVFSVVPSVLMNVIGQGTGAQDNADFDEFVTGLEKVCGGEKQSATGAVALYEGTISFESISSGTEIILVQGNEQQATREIDCGIEDANSMEITGTTRYEISKQNGELNVQTTAIGSP